LSLHETNERPLVSVVAAMERDGIKVDRAAALADLSRGFERRIAEIEQAIFRAVGNISISRRPSSSVSSLRRWGPELR
jgi:DNA polymerase I-like protein with 3'-5' exonuclease and polymerase domains